MPTAFPHSPTPFFKKLGHGTLGFLAGILAGFYVGYKKANNLIYNSTYFWPLAFLPAIQVVAGSLYSVYGLVRGAMLGFKHSVYHPRDVADVLEAPTNKLLHSKEEVASARAYLADRFAGLYEEEQALNRPQIFMDLIRNGDTSKQQMASDYLDCMRICSPNYNREVCENQQFTQLYKQNKWAKVNQSQVYRWAILNSNKHAINYFRTINVDLPSYAKTIFEEMVDQTGWYLNNIARFIYFYVFDEQGVLYPADRIPESIKTLLQNILYRLCDQLLKAIPGNSAGVHRPGICPSKSNAWDSLFTILAPSAIDTTDDWYRSLAMMGRLYYVYRDNKNLFDPNDITFCITSMLTYSYKQDYRITGYVMEFFTDFCNKADINALETVHSLITTDPGFSHKTGVRELSLLCEDRLTTLRAQSLAEAVEVDEVLQTWLPAAVTDIILDYNGCMFARPKSTPRNPVGITMIEEELTEYYQGNRI